MNNKKNGEGTYKWPDGKYYEGGWKDGLMHGRGVLISTDMSENHGIWNAGKKVKSFNKKIKLGEVLDGLRNSDINQGNSAFKKGNT